MSATFPFLLMHRTGHAGTSPCGGPAFFMRRMPDPGDIMKSADAAHLDGRPMEGPAPILCDTCGGIVWPHTSHIVPVSQPAKWNIWLYWWGWTTDGTAEFVVQPGPVDLPEVDLWATIQGRINWDRGETECPPIYPVERRPLRAHIVVPERSD